MPREKVTSTNQRHYLDQGSDDTSSVWNFCAPFLGVIFAGKPVVVFREMSAVFPGYKNKKLHQGRLPSKCKLSKLTSCCNPLKSIRSSLNDYLLNLAPGVSFHFCVTQVKGNKKRQKERNCFHLITIHTSSSNSNRLP